ncbi:MAG TPA: K(+)-transporting ATPase subunit F [Rhizobiaceae bacterium]|nr:K(+)-transporting ATPase subunit F [Rhizobiaceae bacterium]
MTSYLSFSVSGYLRCWRSTPAPSPGCEAVMIESLIGLAVAIALGIYLVVTLLKPERF